MKTLKVQLENSHDRSYFVVIEQGLLKKLPSLLAQKPPGEKYAIICDGKVGQLYGVQLVEALNKKGILAYLITFPEGEKHKTLTTAEKVMAKMLKIGLSRSDAVIALGGGVSGDLGSFIASIYMRGIPYIHVPTTLLAMVDSSIGGKTGVDLTSGKNLAGTFYQPKGVYIDPLVLKTLPQSEFLNGFAEIVKYGVISDSPTSLGGGMFNFLEDNVDKIIRNDSSVLNKLIIQSVRIKAAIIEKDEIEHGVRMYLNYGHTIGHAIEKVSAYTVAHGQAVALGMKLINLMAVRKHLLNANDYVRINNLINKLYLTKFYDLDRKKWNRILESSKLWKIMQNDKKVHASKIRFVVPERIGKLGIYDEVTYKDFITCLKDLTVS